LRPAGRTQPFAIIFLAIEKIIDAIDFSQFKDNGMSEANHSQNKTPISQLISILDRAWDARWAIQLIQLVFFLDLAMMIAGQPGLLGWDSGSAPILDNLNFVIVTLVAFTVYAAILTPLVSSIVAMLIAYMPGVISYSERNSNGLPLNYVTFTDYKREAYEKDDNEMLARYRELEERNQNAEAQQRQVGNIIFGTLVLIALNAFPNIINIVTTDTILQAAIDFIGWETASLIAFFLVLGMFRATTSAWFYTAERWVEHPKLYRKLESEHKAARDDVDLHRY
jgi:hypothetical protein